MNEKNTQVSPEPAIKATNTRPDDTGTISVEGFVKIFDPSTKETFVEKRA
jgi:hypothetical protein